MIILHKLNNLTDPLLCDVCGKPITEVESGIVLFMVRWAKNRAPEMGTINHKNCCDSRKITKSMEFSELLELTEQTWPLPEEPDDDSNPPWQ